MHSAMVRNAWVLAIQFWALCFLRLHKCTAPPDRVRGEVSVI